MRCMCGHPPVGGGGDYYIFRNQVLQVRECGENPLQQDKLSPLQGLWS